jgi:hypothetical protein
LLLNLATRPHVKPIVSREVAWDDQAMAEYGNGVSGVAGQVTGGANDPGRSVDLGASANQFISDSVHTLSTMPPAALLALVVVVFIGLIALKRAF